MEFPIIYNQVVVNCPYCGSLKIGYCGFVHYRYHSTRRFICKKCDKSFTTLDNRMRFPQNLVFYCMDEFMSGTSSRKVQKLVQEKFNIYISVNMPSYWSAKFGKHKIVNNNQRFILIISNLLVSEYNIISKKTFLELIMSNSFSKNSRKILDNNYVIRIKRLRGAFVINKGKILLDFPELKDSFYEGINQEDPTIFFRRKVTKSYGKKRTLYKEVKRLFSIMGRPKGSLKYSLEELSFLKKCCDDKLKYKDIIKKWNLKFNKNLSQEARQLYNLMLRMGWIVPKKRNLTFYEGERTCPKCSSDNTNRRGTERKKGNLCQRFHCKDCGNKFYKKLLK